MALHGEVKVNHEVLLSWQAVNRGPIGEVIERLPVHRYECRVTDELTGTFSEFEVIHNRNFGAAKLAAIVLQRYHALQRVAGG